jgi:hypothetical protein
MIDVSSAVLGQCGVVRCGVVWCGRAGSAVGGGLDDVSLRQLQRGRTLSLGAEIASKELKAKVTLGAI